MKARIFIAVFIFILIFLSVPFHATDTDKIIDEQIEDYGVDDIEEYIPDSAKENAEEYGEITIDEAKSILNVENAIGFCIKVFFSVFGNKARLIIELAALAFVMWLFNVLSEENRQSGIGKILNFVTVAAASAIFFDAVFVTADTLISQFGELFTFLSSLIPVLLTLTAAEGYTATAAAVGSAVSFGIFVVTFLINSFITPFTAMYLSLGIASSMTDSVDFRKIAQSIRNIVNGIFGAIFCVFSAIMVSQKYFALAGDSLSRRTLKFAAGSFLPLAGSGISEGVDTAFACAAVLRTNVGSVGVAVLFFTVVPPVMEIGATLFLIAITRAICGFFENEALASFFSVISNVFAVLLTVSVLAALMVFLSLAVLVRL